MDSGGQRQTAETMAAQQRAISVSEFFAKNRHLLGFDNKRKALLTAVKEAVDNSLDACEEAGILPELHIELEQLLGDDRWRVTVRDNGPGIPRSKVPSVFARLLYGSKFHRLKMSRGQQGIGISAAGMYGLLTTGQPVRVVSRTDGSPASEMRLAIDTNRNRPEVVSDGPAPVPWTHGTEVSIELEAAYARGRQSVDEYVELTAIANPHAEIHYRPPSGPVTFRRAVGALPAGAREIKPHPHGVELGTMMRMLKETDCRSVGSFLASDFCRVGKAAEEVCRAAGVSPSARARSLPPGEAEALYRSLQAAKLKPPPRDCLAPIGAEGLLAGMLKGVRAEFYTASVRPPAVYRGYPFQVEAALAWGGDIAQGEDDPQARVIRFANRVPLLHQPGSCCAHRAAQDIRWGNYGLSQSKGSLPKGPLVVLVHLASVWVPYTSEGKESIADYDEIRREIRLALTECGRRLGALLRRKRRRASQRKRRDAFGRYIGEVVGAVSAMLPGEDPEALRGSLEAIARSHTERADEQFDDHGRVVRVADMPDTILVDRADRP